MSNASPLADELSTVFARMSGLLLSQETVDTALSLVTSLAMETIPHAAAAAVTLVDQQGRMTTTAATSGLAERADVLQYGLEEGPCLAAWASRNLVHVPDVRAEHRWPQWAASVEPLGLRSCLSVPLVAGDRALGALKVYAARPAAFDTHAERVLAMFAAQAAILVANVQAHDRARRVSEDLKEALRGRDLISKAQGVLMGRERVDEHTAFALLVRTASREGRPVQAAARAVVESAARRR